MGSELVKGMAISGPQVISGKRTEIPVARFEIRGELKRKICKEGRFVHKRRLKMGNRAPLIEPAKNL